MFLKKAFSAGICFLSLVTTLSCGFMTTSPKQTEAAGSWVQVWGDEFNGNSVDSSKWNFEIGPGPNNELQLYTPNNVHFESDPNNSGNKYLVIEAKRENQVYNGRTFNYTSSRLNTSGKFDFKYGKIEMRAQLPKGQGMWPAFWMLGSNYSQAGWPDCGELDIMEYVGKTPSTVYGTLHGPNYFGSTGIGAYHDTSDTISTQFHTYTVEWEPNVIRWYVDGQLYQVRTPQDLDGRKWVFDHNFFIILNLAVGGDWPGSPDNTTIFPQDYKIDYVRVYQRQNNDYEPAPAKNFIALKAAANGKFVTVDKFVGDHKLRANRDSASVWEMFEVKDLGNGKVALLSSTDYKYVSVKPDGSVYADKETVGPWETFQVETQANGKKALKNIGNNEYLSADLNLDSVLVANRPTASTWEQFDFVQK
ncbi:MULTISPECIES: family 16 glycosylhydrolase [Thermoactinomyces]|jgi:beta-glucanase (GH16 family)|uniref:Family 16 glycosylhydrolase n=1 Tax=Thermoactinomyces daqus TaxID=1329516 RepID=A0A7W1X7W7_9BACL|nr:MULTISPECIES: family 16 glycosylhydrolase [Thermoactinomyces]MBA4541728.1 family 16 glycosylhydrolase [Thermoactinomyces daqus]MBH8597187.1 family 16 glycosylhydrolase [Thermoactinomyces sp. CICC 10523]MBH8602747.1 family 16 glycosylhydrolase [Thermoactinomyces sp. CICC 10522]MBH8606144.1 family 16 glycosylhydrolase [Thermoactinomyces sp. CICC 10521]